MSRGVERQRWRSEASCRVKCIGEKEEGAQYLATEGGLVEGRSLPCAHIDVVAPRQQQLHYLPARWPGRQGQGRGGGIRIQRMPE